MLSTRIRINTDRVGVNAEANASGVQKLSSLSYRLTNKSCQKTTQLARKG